VSSLIHASKWQYAVISVRTAPSCERLVIAYSDEKSLRELLAVPSIVALGYSSRGEAEASMYHQVTTDRILLRKSMATLVVRGAHALEEFFRGCFVASGKFNLGKTESAIRGLLKHTLVAAAVVFYSQNTLSTTIRALISF
jgi:hypothetical protein